MAKVLLLNPPSRSICMRDYYCSKISKGAYCYHPIDFIVLSGILASQHQVSVVDAIAGRLDRKRSLDAVMHYAPDVVIFLTGAVSFEEDSEFLFQVQSLTRARMIGLGDIFFGSAKKIFEAWAWLDAALLDFTTQDILELVKDNPRLEKNAILRTDGGGIVQLPEVHERGHWELNMPRHELFQSFDYSFPFTRQRRFATVLTNFGCPYSCDYCPVNHFSYKERAIGALQQEFKFLGELGVREIVFKDQTFGGGRERITRICQALFEQGASFGWTCFLRPELLDSATLDVMAAAGCHTIIVGVESGDEAIRRRYHRGYSNDDLQEVFSMCRSRGVETVATFVMGLPGETKESLKQTIRLANSLGCDYASFNIYVPAYGTGLRKALIEEGLVKDALTFMDSGISRPNFSTGTLSANDVWGMRNRALLEFYGRPGYLMRKLVRVGSFSRLTRSLSEGWAVMSSRRSV